MDQLLRVRTLVALGVAGVLLATAAPAAAQPCSKTFTVEMFRQAAQAAYAGAKTPSRTDLAHLQRFVRCARHPWARPVDRRIWTAVRKANAARNMHQSFVSFYDDFGATASGWHSTYGVADCGSGGGPCYPMGTRIRFCYHGCVVAVVDDHGPYVAGREWDLNQNTAAAIGFSGLGWVTWRLE